MPDDYALRYTISELDLRTVRDCLHLGLKYAQEALDRHKAAGDSGRHTNQLLQTQIQDEVDYIGTALVLVDQKLQ